MAKRYAGYLPSTLKQAFIEAVEDEEVMSMKDELALLRSVLSARMKQLEGADVDSSLIKDVSTLVDKISHVQTAMSHHEVRMREMIPITMVPKIIHSIVAIIKRRISDEVLVRFIADDIMNIPLKYERGQEEKLLGNAGTGNKEPA